MKKLYLHDEGLYPHMLSSLKEGPPVRARKQDHFGRRRALVAYATHDTRTSDSLEVLRFARLSKYTPQKLIAENESH